MFVEEKKAGEAPVAEPVDEIAEILLRAADYMEKHGWCRHNYSNPLGEVCLVGALMAVTGLQYEPSPTARTAPDQANGAWYRLQEHLGQSPSYWNDLSCHTKEEAVLALRSAARST